MTPAQKLSPFRATSSGLVIERSLASGNEEEWAHWWDLGQLAKGMGKAGHVTAGILKSATEGFSRPTIGWDNGVPLKPSIGWNRCWMSRCLPPGLG